MSTFLARLGRASFRHRGLVSWPGWRSSAPSSPCWSPSAAPSTTGSRSRARSPRTPSTSWPSSPPAPRGRRPDRLRRPDGSTVTDPAVAGVIEQVVAAARQAPQVASAASPFDSQAISPDGRAALATVEYGVHRGDLDDASIDALQETTAAAKDAGLEVAVGGDAFASTGPDVGPTELLGVAVAVLVLVLTFGSLLAAGMPLLTAFIGIGVGMGGLLAGLERLHALLDRPHPGADDRPRRRHRLRAVHPVPAPHPAARRAWTPRSPPPARSGTAGSAVVFAGLTVIIALCGLSVVGIPFLTVMGLGAAGRCRSPSLIALTLLPALLGFAGARLAPKPGSPRRAARAGRRPGDAPGTGGSMGARWTRLVTRRPLLTVLVVLAGLARPRPPGAAAAARPAGQLAAPPPTPPSGRPTTWSREHFGPGFNGPLVVLVEGLDPATAQQSRADRGRHRRHAHGTPGEFAGGLDDVAVRRPALLPDGTHRPASRSSPRAARRTRRPADLVADIRDLAPGPRGSRPAPSSRSPARPRSASTSPTGSATPCCRSPSSSSGLALVLLLLVFRSILVPLKAAIGFLLIGRRVLRRRGRRLPVGLARPDLLGVPTTGPVISFLPIILIGVLFGLAMDYEVFLVSRMREEYVHGAEAARGRRHRRPPRGPGRRRRGADHVLRLRQLRRHRRRRRSRRSRFGLAVGIFVDAFLVRMTLVPAVLALLGRSAWWLPRWLDRILPDLDVEGARLGEREPAGAVREPVATAH